MATLDLGSVVGPAGKSAYEQAIEAGYKGSEAEFYAALVSLQYGPFLAENATAVSANQLEIAREIGLTGAVTGSADFDGSKNISIETAPKYALVGKTGEDITNNWYKFAETRITSLNKDHNIMFWVWYGYTNAAYPNDKYGVLRAHARSSSANTVIYPWLVWDYAGQDVNLNNFAMCYKTTPDNHLVIELWAKVDLAYDQVHFMVIGEGRRTDVNYTDWTLYHTVTDNGEPDLPSGYNAVYSTMGKIHTGETYVDRLYVGNSTTTTSMPIEFDGGNGKRYQIASGQATINGVAHATCRFSESIDGGANWNAVAELLPNEYTNHIDNEILTKTKGDSLYPTKEYANENYLSRAGGELSGNLQIGYQGAALSTSNSRFLEFLVKTNGTANKFRIQGWSGTTPRLHICIVDPNTNAEKDAVITGVATPLINTDAANKYYVDTAVSALRAELASALSLPALASGLSVPEVAPTLEISEEEEITV